MAHEEKNHEIMTILHAALSRVSEKQTNKQTNNSVKPVLSITPFTFFISLPSFLFWLVFDSLFPFPPPPHTQTQESEEPFYRIASLEGQLRQCQNKLREVQFHHEGVLAAERTAEKEKWDQVTQQLMMELHGVKSELALLKDSKETETNEKSEGEAVPPKVTVSKAEPEVSVKSKGSKKKTKDLDRLREEEREEPLRKLSLGSALVSPLLKHTSRTKSASQETLDGLGLDKVERKGGNEKTRHSLEGERPNGKQRSSITELIEESMRNPQSMAAIRKELKSDGFTPKIQKKFHHSLATVTNSQPQTTPPPLRTLKPTFRN